MLTIFSFSSTCVLITSLLLAFIILWKGRRNQLSTLWACFCIGTSMWGLGGFIFSTNTSPELILLGWQIGYMGVIMTPPIYYHFVYEFLGLKKIYQKLVLFLAYIFALIFEIFVVFAPKYFFSDFRYIYNEFYWHDWIANKNLIWIIFYISFFGLLLGYSFAELIIAYTKSKRTKKNQIRYFIFGSLVGWLGAEGCFLTDFRIDIYPYFNFLIAIYAFIFTYAIVKYRLMDITVAITRTSIFVAVYSLVLGIPFAMAFGWQEQLKSYLGENWWIIPFITLSLFATIGPYLYVYLQRKAENKLFYNRKRFQETLKVAASEMINIKSSLQLWHFICELIEQKGQIEFAAVFTKPIEHQHSPDQKVFSADYVLAAQSYTKETGASLTSIPDEGELIQFIKQEQDVVVFDEIQYLCETEGHIRYPLLADELKLLSAKLVIPIIHHEELKAIIVQGDKISGESYSSEDLALFKNLANQAALALETIQSFEDLRQAQEKLFQAEKLAYIGQLASSVVHEIRNPLTVIKTYVNFFEKKKNDPEYHTKFTHLIPKEINRIENVVQNLLSLSKPKKLDLHPHDVTFILDETLSLLEENLKIKQIKLVKQFKNPPWIVACDRNLMQQVFLNLFINAIQAMEEGGTLTCTVAGQDVQQEDEQSDGGSVCIKVKDTGCGMTEAQLSELFTPFITTKQDGVGLGMVITQEIIQMHDGNILVESQSGAGTIFTVILHKKV